jgi:hypothetical protein
VDEEGWLYSLRGVTSRHVARGRAVGKGQGTLVAWRRSCREPLSADSCRKQGQQFSRASVQARERLSGPLLGDVQLVVAVLIEQQVTDRSYLSPVLSIS